MENGNSMYGMGIQNCFFNPNCDNIVDQRYLFDSALSSIVSSPSNSHSGIQIPSNGGNIVLKELIGRLGSLCNLGENMSKTNSCYNTPLNSPPKLNLSIIDQKIHGNHQFQLAQFSKDPGFVERAAKFSTFCSKSESFKNLGSQSIQKSSVSETETGMKGQNTSTNTNGRKRKGKGKETVKDGKGVTEVESDAKRSKSNDEKKSTEPPKDYIHVRARRGQATDSHSLAERVRREKISERMKFLQDLVPGCNKVTGKAVMLDEIINYVQSLQRQVEFLSMKLATVNPWMDASMEALLSKDMFRPRVSIPTNMNPFDASTQPFPYGFQSPNNGTIPDGSENQFSAGPSMVAIHRNSIMKPSHIDGFGEASTLWENDLQSVVKMALGQDQPQEFHGQIKVEL